jgi:DNA-binding transcriptional LysR family regulator
LRTAPAKSGTEILRRFAELRPLVEMRFAEAGSLEEIQRQVRDRETDVAFAWLPVLYEELVVQHLRSEGLLIAASRQHRLASLETLRCSDLSAEPIVAPWDEVPEDVLRPWLGLLRPTGRQPHDVSAKGLDESLAIASSGRAVYCVPDSV